MHHEAASDRLWLHHQTSIIKHSLIVGRNEHVLFPFNMKTIYANLRAHKKHLARSRMDSKWNKASHEHWNLYRSPPKRKCSKTRLDPKSSNFNGSLGFRILKTSPNSRTPEQFAEQQKLLSRAQNSSPLFSVDCNRWLPPMHKKCLNTFDVNHM